MVATSQQQQHSALTSDYFLYLPEHQVAICRLCECAVRPGEGNSSIQRHLRTLHKTVSLQVRKALVESTKDWALAQPDAVAIPSPGSPPVEGLKVLDGWSCSGCGYVCLSEASMQEHCRSQHTWKKAQGRQWQPQKTFFQSTKRKYFVVTPRVAGEHRQQDEETSSERLDRFLEARLADAQRERAEEHRKLGIVPQDLHAVDKSPWMRRTGWLRRFAGKDMDAIAKMGIAATRGEHGLRLVSSSVARVFNRCVDGITDCMHRDWSLLLFWLNSHSKDKPDSKPFTVDQHEKSTVERYIGHWQRFLCYCLRILGKEAEYGVEFLPRQLQQLEELKAMVAGPVAPSEELTDALVMDLSVQFAMHLVFGPCRSVLVHFCGVLGYDGNTRRFRLPMTYTPILAGLQFCLRVLLFEHALPTGSRDDLQQRVIMSGRSESDPLATFLRVRDAWLVDGQPSPFDHIHKLLLYGMVVAKDTGKVDRVLWSKDKKTIRFNGQPLEMDQFRGFIQSLISAAEEILSRDLLFGDDQRVKSVDLSCLTDDVNLANIGHSFVCDPDNGLDGGWTRVAAQLRKSSAACARLISADDDSRLRFKRPGVEDYETAVKKFLEYMLLLIHITGGQPARGTEITSIRYANAMHALRNIFIEDGQVMVVIDYHKAQGLTDQPRVIPRFLPDRIGRLLVVYLADVLPFRQLIDDRRASTLAISGGFLWAKGRGNGRSWPWETEELTRAMTRETGCRLGLRLTTQAYRHIAIAIDREHVRGLTAGMDLGDDEDDPHDLMASHTTAMAEKVYGIDSAVLRSLSSRSIEIFRNIAGRWHAFLRLSQEGKDSNSNGSNSNSNSNSNNGSNQSPRLARSLPTAQIPDANRRRAVVVDGATEDVVDDDLEPAMQKELERFIGPDASFKSPEQKEGLAAVLRGESPLVVILPTGGGKSLLFMLPAQMDGARTTIVVTPFIALAEDMANRCEAACIPFIKWKPGPKKCTASVVIVSAEAAGSGAFMNYAAGLCEDKKLDRIVIDECHLTITAADYRVCMTRLKRLAVAAPLVLLTATMPPTMEKRLEEAMVIPGARYIRALTHRWNFAYSVETCDAAKIEDRAFSMVMEAECRMTGEEQRVVVFCRSRDRCESLANKLACGAYHSTYKGKEESLQAWIRGDYATIIATAALGVGVDLAGICEVIHVEQPYSLIDYAQESGRAGRRGEKVRATILLSHKKYEQLQHKAPDIEGSFTASDAEALRSYITTDGCRRVVLGGYLDGEEGRLECSAALGSEACDRCRQRKLAVEAQARLSNQAHDYSGRVKRVRMDQQEESRREERMREVLARLQGKCVNCWVLTGQVSADHLVGSCPQWRPISGYDALRRRIKYFQDGCCFVCSVPGDWCEDYKQHRKCGQQDIVAAVCLCAWSVGELRRVVEEMAGRGFANEWEYLEWIGKKGRTMSIEGTNGLRAFEAVISHLSRREGE